MNCVQRMASGAAQHDRHKPQNVATRGQRNGRKNYGTRAKVNQIRAQGWQKTRSFELQRNGKWVNKRKHGAHEKQEPNRFFSLYLAASGRDWPSSSTSPSSSASPSPPCSTSSPPLSSFSHFQYHA